MRVIKQLSKVFSRSKPRFNKIAPLNIRFFHSFIEYIKSFKKEFLVRNTFANAYPTQMIGNRNIYKVLRAYTCVKHLIGRFEDDLCPASTLGRI